MTKLPKSLEEKRDTKADKVQVPHFAKSFSERAGHIASYKDGYDSGALEVKALADRSLVKALRDEKSHWHPLNENLRYECIACEALAEWAAFWEGK